MKLSLHRRESVLEELEAMQRRITERAFEIFNRRGALFGRALDDWLSAEREAIWKPPVELCEKDDEFLVEAALAGVDAKHLDVQITSEELLLSADIAHQHRPGEKIHMCEFRPGKMFRVIRFPRRIDPDKVRADYRDGLLRLWASAAKESEARQVKIAAA
jgi:HSP20 family protein